MVMLVDYVEWMESLENNVYMKDVAMTAQGKLHILSATIQVCGPFIEKTARQV